MSKEEEELVYDNSSSGFSDFSDSYLVHFHNQAIGAMTTHASIPTIVLDLGNKMITEDLKAIFIDFSANDGPYVCSSFYLSFLFFYILAYLCIMI